MNNRDGTIYVSSDVLWLYGKVVKAMNESRDTGISASAAPMTIDNLASDVLLQWIRQTHPKLIDLHNRRKSLDDEALALLKEKKS